MTADSGQRSQRTLLQASGQATAWRSYSGSNSRSADWCRKYQQTADSRQQTADSRQQTADSAHNRSGVATLQTDSEQRLQTKTADVTAQTGRQQQINRPDSIAQHSRQPRKLRQTADKQTADSSRVSDSRQQTAGNKQWTVMCLDPYHTREGRELRSEVWRRKSRPLPHTREGGEREGEVWRIMSIPTTHKRRQRARR
jgi:hypothetical protein